MISLLFCALLDSLPVIRAEVDQAKVLQEAVEGMSSTRTTTTTTTFTDNLNKCDHMADLFSTGHHVQRRNPTDKFHIFRTLCFFDVFSFFLYIIILLPFSPLPVGGAKACSCLYFALVCERIVIAEPWSWCTVGGGLLKWINTHSRLASFILNFTIPTSSFSNRS